MVALVIMLSICCLLYYIYRKLWYQVYVLNMSDIVERKAYRNADRNTQWQSYVYSKRGLEYKPYTYVKDMHMMRAEETANGR